MKDCFIGYHAESIKHISTAIALSAFINIFHFTVYSYNLKFKILFSYSWLNFWGEGCSIHLEKIDTTVFLYREVSVFKNVSVTLLKTKIPGVCKRKVLFLIPPKPYIFNIVLLSTLLFAQWN